MDWVYNTHYKQNEQVEELGSNCVMLAYNDLYAFDEIQPIPLTPEILEKNLSTEPQIAWCVGWHKKDDIHVEIQREDLNAAFYGVVDFVHQLQHALRLCGITREIIL